MEYEIRLTPIAEAFAKAKASVAAIRQRAHEEVDILMEVGNLVFHTFNVAGVEFICYLTEDGALEIDTCSREPPEFIPIPDSE